MPWAHGFVAADIWAPLLDCQRSGRHSQGEQVCVGPTPRNVSHMQVKALLCWWQVSQVLSVTLASRALV